MEGHKRKPSVDPGNRSLTDRLLADYDKYPRLVRWLGRFVMVAGILFVAFGISLSLLGRDWSALLRLAASLAIQHLLIYHGIGYWAIPQLPVRRPLRFGLAFGLVFWLCYSINRTVVLSLEPTVPQAVQYTRRLNALLRSTNWLGCFVSLRLFLWNVAFSFLSPVAFLSVKLLKDSVVYRQRQFVLIRNRLLLERDNGLLKLNFLKAQVSPHFLFNTLNSIYARVVGVDDSAADLVLRLAELMRYNLYEATAPRLPVDQELAYIRSYTVLEQARHGEQLAVSLEAESFAGYEIAPLLLIPFVENAFKHGGHWGGQTAYVRIRAIRRQNSLLFTVENNIHPGPTVVRTRKSGGVGLPNVRKRLTLLYPNQHHIEYAITHDYYRITLRLDLAPVRQSSQRVLPATP